MRPYRFSRFPDAFGRTSPVPLSLIGSLFIVLHSGLAAANPPSVTSAGLDLPPESRRQLGLWRFNAETLRGEQGQMPIEQVGLRTVVSTNFDGLAVIVHNTNGPALLRYRAMEPGGSANFDGRTGSLRFLFRPFWGSHDRNAPPGYGWGRGPGQWARLFEVGGPDPNRKAPLFALSIDPSGTNLVFQTAEGRGGPLTNVWGKISFTHPQGGSAPWHEIVLTWSPQSSALIVNGNRIGVGAGLSRALSPAELERGFVIGSSADGSLPAQGAFDDFETFNHPIEPIDIYDYKRFEQAAAMTTRVESSPPRVTLSWLRYNGGRPPIVVHKRRVGDPAWSILASNHTALTFTDTEVSLGNRYEYHLGNTNSTYVLVGVNAAPVERRGRVILLVERSLARSLANELEQFSQDLTGDGWTVLRHDVPRHDDKDWSKNPPAIKAIKAQIVADHAAAPAETRAIFLIGRVPIPHAGEILPDGHPDHKGAWAVDAFYGDVDGTWTDTSVNYKNTQYFEKTNLPGDGKFDQIFFPSPIELAVGRIDFALLNSFHKSPPKGVSPLTEAAMIRQYLAKNHRYRHKELVFPPRSVVAGKFFDGTQPPPNPYFLGNQFTYWNAVRNGSRWYPAGDGRIVAGDLFSDQASHLWGFQCGFGNFNAINTMTRGDTHTTPDLADPRKEPKSGFHMFDGSYFGDWNYWDNLMMASLVPANSGLASMWARQIVWNFETAGLGEPIGEGFVRTVNAPNHLGQPKGIWLALLGDPTLRLQVVAPPRHVKSARRGRDQVTVSWSRSPEADARYLVYRSASLDAPFTRVTDQPVEGTDFTDRTAPSGRVWYQVRAAKLEVTGSGSYTNLSQGVFVNVRD